MMAEARSSRVRSWEACGSELYSGMWSRVGNGCCEPTLSCVTPKRRLQAVRRAADILKVDLITVPYRHEAWRELVRDRERDAERGARCQLCYRERLQAAYDFAKRRGFRYFSTSLLVSPYKDGEAIRKICRELAAEGGPVFLNQDFQADNGFRASLDWARERGLYLQRYCGCEFSFRK